VLSENLQDIYRDDAPRRATEIKLGEGQIGYGEQVYMRVNATAVGNRSNHSPALNVSITPVRYTLGDTAVVYSTGAIFVERDDSARMASRPDWLLDEDMVAISQVQTAPSVDTASLSGPGTILVTAAGGSPSVIEFAPGSRVRVNVTVKTPRTVAWKRAYQSDADAIWIDDAEGSVTLQFLADNATVVRTGVSVGLQT
jgi:hypothetical protein